jgi:hypothetical protein
MRIHRYKDRQGYHHNLLLDVVINPRRSPEPIGPVPAFGFEHTRFLEQVFGQDILSLWTLMKMLMARTYVGFTWMHSSLSPLQADQAHTSSPVMSARQGSRVKSLGVSPPIVMIQIRIRARACKAPGTNSQTKYASITRRFGRECWLDV